ncbi:MAG: class I SAM-dependent methyltransferase [Myxococcota bacterium]|nr:class I SAM-dependent methyltransferase [Myxococcota bacterium]
MRAWSSDAPSDAIARTVGALPLLKRPYASARFRLFGARVVERVSRALPRQGRLLDVGCGIGLLSSYLALREPGRTLVGVEPDAAKVAVARRAARALDLESDYLVGTLDALAPGASFDGIVASDVLHHVPRHEQEPLLRRLIESLRPTGTLVIKEVTTRPLRKHALAYVTDLVMAGPREPFSFRHHTEWASLLAALGLEADVELAGQGLPYAHVLVTARRRA